MCQGNRQIAGAPEEIRTPDPQIRSLGVGSRDHVCRDHLIVFASPVRFLRHSYLDPAHALDPAFLHHPRPFPCRKSDLAKGMGMCGQDERAPIYLFAPATPECIKPDGQRSVRRGDPAPSPPDLPPDCPRGVRAATPTPKSERGSWY
jgi:hypothetical protein